MSDDRIIDFNELKNKVKDSDVDKFEQYIYNLYFSVMDGKMSMAEFSRKIFDYMKDNDISQEKFMKIQKQFMERYGMDTEEVEKQLRNFGIDPSTAGFMSNNTSSKVSTEDLESFKKSAGFYEKYGEKIQPKSCITTFIKNDLNDINVIIDQEKIMLCSDKKINLMDSELNEFLLEYKNMFNKKIKVVMCETTNKYDY
ncbi:MULTISPECIES: DUF3867 domain-containing protein [unclassified Clostridioides]|uniref:DUF3867 domain-containing protein n=1 Tax=unclassified Clostridioides TaxID=2635829 RepID=UPI001D0C1025|nr:DUF3867 domain-containing protein [Clostridioides sp. ZZV15-6388]MCC0636873.1 DUF3867 domain-containing protein [Clostridioides sp. ES-S-0001-02]MCC0640327.1 DUF3867 domain-containing protein [Clostridioides sp. ES-S-0049-03]MCC0643893.1 DUF3867 domain-containing protein [Clostridioides sp. ZZV14-6150]MCC0657695.1 DUF3867 domain-containing protein [Clostridioides sp. ES-S-0123-01]MCC0659597.1 DUF3867 domain-containing protein [Clostridioides sp. ZZV14-6154]MCC0663716.1 DUF3867 domain-conta